MPRRRRNATSQKERRPDQILLTKYSMLIENLESTWELRPRGSHVPSYPHGPLTLRHRPSHNTQDANQDLSTPIQRPNTSYDSAVRHGTRHHQQRETRSHPCHIVKLTTQLCLPIVLSLCSPTCLCPCKHLCVETLAHTPPASTTYL